MDTVENQIDGGVKELFDFFNIEEHTFTFKYGTRFYIAFGFR